MARRRTFKSDEELRLWGARGRIEVCERLGVKPDENDLRLVAEAESKSNATVEGDK